LIEVGALLIIVLHGRFGFDFYVCLNCYFMNIFVCNLKNQSLNLLFLKTDFKDKGIDRCNMFYVRT
jgi:hypothetical protein